MTLPLKLTLATNYKLEAVSNSGSVQGQPRTTPRVMFKTYEFVAHSWFLICIVRKSRSNGPSPAPCGAAPHFSPSDLAARSRQDKLSLVDCVLGSTQCQQPMDFAQLCRIPVHADMQSASRKDVERAAFFARIPRSATRFSVRVPARGARWVAGGGRSRTA